MAPERFVGRGIDGRADVYSRLRTVRVPTVRRRSRARPPRAYVCPALRRSSGGQRPGRRHTPLDAVIGRGMAKDPNDRFDRRHAGRGGPRSPADRGTGSADDGAAGPRHGPRHRTPRGGPRRLRQPGHVQRPSEAQPPADRYDAPGVTDGATQTVYAGGAHDSGGPRPPENTPSERRRDRRRLGLVILAVVVRAARRSTRHRWLQQAGHPRPYIHAGPGQPGIHQHGRAGQPGRRRACRPGHGRGFGKGRAGPQLRPGGAERRSSPTSPARART